MADVSVVALSCLLRYAVIALSRESKPGVAEFRSRDFVADQLDFMRNVDARDSKTPKLTAKMRHITRGIT